MTDRRSYDPFAPHPPIQAAEPDPAPNPEPAASVEGLADLPRVELVRLAEDLSLPTYGSRAAIAERLYEAGFQG